MNYHFILSTGDDITKNTNGRIARLQVCLRSCLVRQHHHSPIPTDVIDQFLACYIIYLFIIVIVATHYQNISSIRGLAWVVRFISQHLEQYLEHSRWPIHICGKNEHQHLQFTDCFLSASHIIQCFTQTLFNPY